MGDCLGKQDVAVLVKKEVHESELLFLAQRTKRDSVGKAVGASKASVAAFLTQCRKRDSVGKAVGANGSERCRFG